MSPEFSNWVTGKDLGFSHQTDGEDAERAHDLFKAFIDDNPAVIAIERANASGGVCQSYPNRYERRTIQTGFDPEAKRYDKYWKGILRQRRQNNNPLKGYR